ncbi:MAG: Asp-tRNA(Asn)/Glu-tRNA(Gln) amidotransferase subunit GatB, partial [Candidatus Omnitrophica bacterium]|nr:Asp-tRNA(Asn)/Glu-tRNA(Gln) amidotransferase subunit GatB [Candidatus Omnitrophota bacterium]
VDGKQIEVRIHRAHIEEDAGKLVHKADGSASLVDFNRTGMPLIEIVTEPDLRGPDEAVAYLQQLRTILQYLEVSDCDMEKGSLRCDANISLRPKSVGANGRSPLLGTKVEIKNMNSFKSIRSALLFEIKRQSEELERGNRIPQETRLWDQEEQVTRSMRSKEEAHDYRYFPEPDLVPFLMTEEVIEQVRKNLPELASQRQRRFFEQYELPEYDAAVLTRDKWIADYFETCARLYPKPKIVANWIMGDLMAQANERGMTVADLGCKPEWLVQLLELVDGQTISGKMAKELLVEIVQKKQPPREIVAGKGLAQITDEKSLWGIIEGVIGKNQKSTEDYRGGKTTALMFLVGQVMKETGGKANPQKVQELLKKKLEGGGV